jgi:acetylornithine deacetylase/succinyl-diaminopimelate desuccinylase-like protein
MSDIERRALDFIDRQQAALVDFASRLIAIPSPNPPGNELAAARVAEAQMHTLGLANTTIVGPSPERANLICHVKSGTPGRTLLLNGHLDTKPPDPLDGWHTDPYQAVIKDGKLYGLGAADMKGPDAALLFGLAAILQSGATLSGDIYLALSADEEGAADDGARFLVQQRGMRADAALIAEPCGITKNWEMIPLISRGVSCLRFVVEGTQTHSSISDRVPIVNASLEASRLLVFLADNLELHHPPTPLCPTGPTKNLGAVFKGGQAIAKVSGHAEFHADIRTLPGMTKEQLARDIDRAINAFRQQRPAVEVSWSFFDGTLAFTQPTQIPDDNSLVGAVQNAARTVLGEAPPLGYFPGGTDAIWWQGAGGIPTIPGFGPGLLSNCHKPNEFVEVNCLIEAAKIYALTILHYLGAANG